MRVIPRAIYYLSPIATLKSLALVVLDRGLKRSNLVILFQEKFRMKIDQKFAYATGHARIAFHGILRSLKLPPGSEILMTPINLPDMANAIYMNELVPRFCDYQPRSIDPDFALAQSLITDRTKVFMYTHLYGISPNMDLLKSFCLKNNLLLIQDCTQSVGVKFKDEDITGFGDINFFSLCDLKIIQTHRGGIVTANDEIIFNKVVLSLQEKENKPSRKYFINFILEDLFFSFLLRRNIYHILMVPFLWLLFKKKKQKILENFTKGEGIYFLGRLWFRNIFGDEGSYRRLAFPQTYYYSFCELQAKVGLVALQKMDHIDRLRIDNSLRFLNGLDHKVYKNNALVVDLRQRNVFWKIPLFCNHPDELQSFLFKRSIDSAPINLPLINSILAFKNGDESFNADFIKRFGICIPIHHYLTHREIDYIAKSVNDYFGITE